MKKILLLFLLTIILDQYCYSKIDVEKVKSEFSVIQKTGMAGRDFWLTFAPIDPRYSFEKEKKIYIMSSVKTKVKLSVVAKKEYRTYNIEPNVINLILVPNAIAEPIDFDTTQIENSSLYEDAAIHLTSEYPIIVYGFTKSYIKGEGYSALPTFAAGKNYKNIIHISSNFADRLVPCYTSVISPYDSTNVKITLGGGELEDDEIVFKDGRVLKTGDTTFQKMNKGDVLLLSANANKQDISGSLFESDKPIKLVSAVDEKDIPDQLGFRNYLAIMEYPINLWGKTFFFNPLINKDSVAIFRAFASEDNTNVFMNGELIGNIKKGGGGDYGESYIEFQTWYQSINLKPATITSDKPIALAYYNTHERDDSIAYHNTKIHLFQVPTVEMGTTSAMVATPNAPKDTFNKYDSNHLCLIFPLDNNSIPNDLRILKYDSLGKPIETIKVKANYSEKLTHFEGEFENRKYGSIIIPLDDYHVYQINSDSSKFVSYSYGTTFTAGYGLISGCSLYDRNTKDISPPIVKYEQQCNGNILMGDATATEMSIDEEFSSNFADFYLMASENYLFEWEVDSGEFIPGITNSINWSLRKINQNKEASALLYFVDKAGNDTIIYIESDADPIVDSNEVHIELYNPSITSLIIQDTLRNNSDTRPIYVTRIELSGADSSFKIDSYSPKEWEPGMMIAPNQEIYINVLFESTSLLDTTEYSDSLYVGIGTMVDNEITECRLEPLSEIKINTSFPKYELLSSNNFGEFEKDSEPITLHDTLRNLSENRQLFVSRIELKDYNKGFKISGFKPVNWDVDTPIEPESEIIINVTFNPDSILQTMEDQSLTDSLGIGISEFNLINELEEIEFKFTSEQIALLKAKDPESSVSNSKIINKYIEIVGTLLTINEKAFIDGYFELSIYTLEGIKTHSIPITEQKSISLSNLSSGKYFITLRNSKGIVTDKISIVK